MHNSWQLPFNPELIVRICPDVPPPVVLMVGYVLYHINRACLREGNLHLSPSLAQFVAPDAIAIHFARTVVRDNSAEPIRLVINRRLAQSAIDDGRPAGPHSIVAQVSIVFTNERPTAGRASPLPWKVRFVGEPAIDAGGPARELLNEFASSIFQPTTGLVIPAPTAPDFFVPFPNSHGVTINNQFRTIGKFLGIIIRTGLCQALPFAPFVWRYLVGERPGEADIVEVDTVMGNVFRSLRDGTNTAQEWSLLTWTGQTVYLPNRNRGAVVGVAEVADYIVECVAYRLDSIVPFLEQMKAGFFENVGLKRSALLSSLFLSRACQGEVIITVADLKQCVEYEGYLSHDIPIEILWTVVEELTNEERSLFLRFITTLTRLPGRAAGTFKILICRRACHDPNRELIRAATCFNRLILPPYTRFDAALRMIRLAIHLTPTMEVA
jgi:hypothetical protein